MNIHDAIQSNILTSRDLSAFSPPDFDAPFDLDAYLACIPDGAERQGALLAGMQVQFSHLNDPRLDAYPTFQPFRSYPLELANRYALDVARALYPDQTDREALRRMGAAVVNAFKSTLIGRQIVSPDADLPTLLRNIDLAYTGQATITEVDVHEVTANHALITFRKNTGFLDCLSVGTLESLVASFQRSPHVWLRLDTLADGDVLLHWS